LGNASGGSVSDAYATGGVSGASNVGGLVGSAAGTSIQRTYATGQVSGSGSGEGALVGNVDSSVYVSGSFGSSTANGGMSLLGNGSSPGATFLAETQFGDWSNFASEGWTYGTVWVGGSAGPRLVVNGNIQAEPCLDHAQSHAPPFLLGMEVEPDGSA